MTRFTHKLLSIALAGAAGVGCLFINEHVSLTQPLSLVSTADARIGRPLTPLSYAGVARRTTRRAVATGVAVGVATGVAVGAATRRCGQFVDAYGRVYTRC